jgi:hypothetical protein
MAILVSLVALLLAGTALAEGPASGWYRGLIGRTATALDTPERHAKNREVEMELRVDDAGRISGRYFYFDVHREGGRGADIAIEGRIARDGTTQLEEKIDGKVTGRWQDRSCDLGLSGTWVDPTGRRKLRFVLQLLGDEEGDEHQVTPQVAYRGRRVVGTNLQLPFLTRHPRPDVMKKVAFSDLFRDYGKEKDAILETLFGEAAANRSEECRESVASWPQGDAEPGDRPASGPRLLGDSIGFHLTPAALHVEEVGLPHVIAACGLSAEAQYGKLRRFVAPQSPLAPILDGGEPAR